MQILESYMSGDKASPPSDYQKQSIEPLIDPVSKKEPEVDFFQ
jgi:hypothetical protein